MRRNVEKTLFACVVLGLLFAVAFVVSGQEAAKWISGAFAIACFVQMGWIMGDNHRETHEYERGYERD